MIVPVIGIDPGGVSTGVIARLGPRVIYGATVTRDGKVTDYLAEVGRTIERAIDKVWRDQNLNSLPIQTCVIAVEDLNEPSPHMGLTNVGGLIGAAQVLGAVIYAYPAAVIVAPGGHGSAPLSTYPASLVGKREVVGTGKFRHLRSAWDLAGAAVVLSSR